MSRKLLGLTLSLAILLGLIGERRANAVSRGACPTPVARPDTINGEGCPVDPC
jgi:hypothetical protein